MPIPARCKGAQLACPACRPGGSNHEHKGRDPALVAGRETFMAEAAPLTHKVRANRPADPARPVWMPGDNAEASIRAADRDGVAFDPRVWSALEDWAGRLGVATP